jgi:type IV pilus assembly protein PilQ
MKFKRMLTVGVMALVCGSTALAASSQLNAVQVKESEKQVIVSLKTAGSFAHKEYRADQHLLLVDLTDVTAANSLDREVARSSSMLKGYKLLTYTSASGADVTRLSLQLGDDVTYEVQDQVSGLDLIIKQSAAAPDASAAPLSPAPQAGDSSVPAYAKPIVKDSYKIVPTAAPAPPSAVAAPQAASPAAPAAAAPKGEAALVGVAARRVHGGGVDVAIDGPGWVHAFMLKDPPRLVMDFENTVVKTPVRKLTVPSPEVLQIRVSRFQDEPPVARIVVDLNGPHEFEVEPTDHHVLVHIKPGAAETLVAKAEIPAAPPVNGGSQAEDAEAPANPAAASAPPQPASAPLAKPEAEAAPAPAPAAATQAASAEPAKPQPTSVGNAFAPMLTPASAPPNSAAEETAKTETAASTPAVQSASSAPAAAVQSAASAPAAAVQSASSAPAAESVSPASPPAQPAASVPAPAPAPAQPEPAPVQSQPAVPAPAQPVVNASADVAPAPAKPAYEQPVMKPAASTDSASPAVTAETKPAPVVESKPAAVKPVLKEAKLTAPPRESAASAPAMQAEAQSSVPDPANNAVATRLARATDLAPATTGGAVYLHPLAHDEEPSAPPAAQAASPARASAFRSADRSMLLARLQQPVSQSDSATNTAAVNSGPKYTGEPISVNLKDVDLKDFFRLIHEISGLNIVLDPSVHGTVTLVLDDVPWDQALDIVLKNNSLDRELQGNVLRIATTDTLRKEAVDRRAQSEAVALAVDRQTITRFLSYAKAKDVLLTLKKFLSARGDIIQDDRTNAIIISDIPSVIPNLDRLIAQLDRKSQEVEIEVRVVSATRSFSRDLGAQLGFQWGNGVTNLSGSNPNGSSTSTSTSSNSNSNSSSSSSSSGTTTTTNSTISSIPLFTNLPASGPSTGLLLSNITHSYGIDAILTAAEQHNMAKVLSRPRVVTQSNVKAEVKQGSKLPVYQASTSTTNATVTYIDAVLRLSVTPQITSDHTVFLTVDVENTQPNGQTNGNFILTTQQATTQVLVSDGGTVVIGGVIQTTNSVSTQQTPVLGNIPFLGNLFKERLVKTETDELIFFITPKIIEM